MGSGGSILTVPVLTYLVGQEEKIAIARSLGIVGTISLVAGVPYARSRLVHYLLATSHVNADAFTNRDIRSGAFRRLDLFSPPFGFPREVLYEIDDWIPPHPERKMLLWERSQLMDVVERLATGS